MGSEGRVGRVKGAGRVIRAEKSSHMKQGAMKIKEEGREGQQETWPWGRGHNLL